MSWIFLVDGFAYKLKKPVKYDFLDFSSVDERRRCCQEEVRLNRRLAPDVYLDTVALIEGADGGYHLGGNGHAADWLVKMRRLPAGRTLQAGIANHTVSEEDVRRLVARLTRFYAGAERVTTDPKAYRTEIEADIRNSRLELGRPVFGLCPAVIDEVTGRLMAALDHQAGPLENRARCGNIIDGHGDLRPEHIYLGADPVVIDCIEFNRKFRIADPVDELAYLVMECERLRADSIHDWVFRAYRELSSDTFDDKLVVFYKAYRALVRAKIAIWHLADDNIQDRDKWVVRCGDYLALVTRYL